MTSEERGSTTAQSTGEPILLDYAGRVDSRRRFTLAQVRRMCLVAAIASVLVGVIVREDIGSGAFVLNPLRMLAAGGLFLAASIHVAARILEEERIPGWSRVVLIACASASILLIPIAYHGWNRWRSHRWTFALQDERFVRPFTAILATIAVFAGVRMYLWRYGRRNAMSSENGAEASVNEAD